MAFATLTMEHPDLGKIKLSPVGFSWTCLFFTIWVPLFRLHVLAFLGWFAILVAAITLAGIGVSEHFYHLYSPEWSLANLVSLITVIAGFSWIVNLILGILGIVMGFLYNRQHLRHLIRKGYKSTNRLDTVKTIARKLGMKIPVFEPSTLRNEDWLSKHRRPD